MKHRITVLPNKKTIMAEQGDLLMTVLAENGYSIATPCGGNGTCGKCKVWVVSDTETEEPFTNGSYLYACKTYIDRDLTIVANEQIGKGLDRFIEKKVEGEQSGFGVALDVGTTTLAACLVDLKTGEIIRKTSCLNPQGVLGADVLSRIRACQDGKLQTLQKLILNKTAEILEEIAMGQAIKELVVSANTTMLHLFLGVNPEPIGVAPFTPVFTGTQYCLGKQLGLSVEKVRLLPSVSGYIGSDITVGMLACDILQKENTALFVDIGTNGEIVLCNQGILYATSTAAGPALEGACIECGLGGVDGAIDRVYVCDGKLVFTTIGSLEAKGICGSGLIDLIAVLLVEELIDENGTWNEESNSILSDRLQEDKFYLTDSIYISQKDIRQFQLAKAAIMAGIETLLYESKVNIDDVETLYIAGGLGYYLDVKNAGSVGLLPKSLLSKIKLVGNTSLQGAVLCILKQDYQEKIENISIHTNVIELSCSKYFQDAYIDHISFLE